MRSERLAHTFQPAAFVREAYWTPGDHARNRKSAQLPGDGLWGCFEGVLGVEAERSRARLGWEAQKARGSN